MSMENAILQLVVPLDHTQTYKMVNVPIVTLIVPHVVDLDQINAQNVDLIDSQSLPNLTLACYPLNAL